MARADRRREARARSDAGFERKYQSAYVGTEGLFFPRLRTHAKWVFVFLAAVVRARLRRLRGRLRPSRVGLDQLFQGNAGGGAPSVDEAQERVREQPRNARGAARARGRPPAERAPGRGDRAARAAGRRAPEGRGHAQGARRAVPRARVAPRAGGGGCADGDRGARPRTRLPAAGDARRSARRCRARSSPRRPQKRRRTDTTQAYSGLQAAYGKAKITYERLAPHRPEGPDHPDPAGPGGAERRRRGDGDRGLQALPAAGARGPDDAGRQGADQGPAADRSELAQRRVRLQRRRRVAATFDLPGGE